MTMDGCTNVGNADGEFLADDSEDRKVEAAASVRHGADLPMLPLYPARGGPAES